MEEYKSNSYRSKELQKKETNENNKPQDRKVEKVVTGIVKTKKKSKISQAMDNFISEDAKNVKSYILGEVLIPAIKKAISDIVTDGIDIILYGETRGKNRRSTADRVSYRSYYDDRGSRNRMNERQAIMAGSYSYDDIILSTRGEAEDVLSRMDELIETYGLVRVADLYDLVGITGNYTDNKYGWMNIRNAEIMRVRDGYMIKMPRAVPID